MRDGTYTQLSDGTWVPGIPEPFWLPFLLFWSVPACYDCRIKFLSRSQWEEHYIKYHCVTGSFDGDS